MFSVSREIYTRRCRCALVYNFVLSLHLCRTSQAEWCYGSGLNSTPQNSKPTNRLPTKFGVNDRLRARDKNINRNSCKSVVSWNSCVEPEKLFARYNPTSIEELKTMHESVRLCSLCESCSHAAALLSFLVWFSLFFSSNFSVLSFDGIWMSILLHRSGFESASRESTHRLECGAETGYPSCSRIRITDAPTRRGCAKHYEWVEWKTQHLYKRSYYFF